MALFYLALAILISILFGFWWNVAKKEVRKEKEIKKCGRYSNVTHCPDHPDCKDCPYNKHF